MMRNPVALAHGLHTLFPESIDEDPWHAPTRAPRRWTVPVLTLREMAVLVRPTYSRPPRDQGQWLAWASGLPTTGPRWESLAQVEAMVFMRELRARPVVAVPVVVVRRRSLVVEEEPEPVAAPAPKKKRGVREGWIGWRNLQGVYRHGRAVEGWTRPGAEIHASEYRDENGWTAYVSIGLYTRSRWFPLARDAREWCYQEGVPRGGTKSHVGRPSKTALSSVPVTPAIARNETT